MQQFTPWQCNKDRHARTPALRQCLVLLLILAIAASGFLHVVGDSHGSVAAPHPHDLASLAHDADGKPHSDHDCVPHGAVCGTTSSCSFYMPVTLSAAPARSSGEPAFVEPEAEHAGLAPAPHARPPKLLKV